MRDHEPSSTTVAGRTGLEGYEAVIHSLARCRPPLLVDNGWLMVRVNARQHQNVRRLFQERSACRSASLSY
jgi:methylase of polypeptide subunit release factors